MLKIFYTPGGAKNVICVVQIMFEKKSKLFLRQEYAVQFNDFSIIRCAYFLSIQIIWFTHQTIMWWQQGGASCHTSNASIRYLRGKFPGRLMGKRGDWPWPPRSPDLTVCVFFPWRYLKEQIWNVPTHEQPTIVDELCQAIFTACENLQL